MDHSPPQQMQFHGFQWLSQLEGELLEQMEVTLLEEGRRGGGERRDGGGGKEAGILVLSLSEAWDIFGQMAPVKLAQVKLQLNSMETLHGKLT